MIENRAPGIKCRYFAAHGARDTVVRRAVSPGGIGAAERLLGLESAFA
jgi:hypothetical protein